VARMGEKCKNMGEQAKWCFSLGGRTLALAFFLLLVLYFGACDAVFVFVLALSDLSFQCIFSLEICSVFLFSTVFAGDQSCRQIAMQNIRQCGQFIELNLDSKNTEP
jgi:hypothetical protein